MGGEISALDWARGIFLSIMASIIGGISKLAIRKSWLMHAETNHHSRRVSYENEYLSGEDNLIENTLSNNSANQYPILQDDDGQIFDEQRNDSIFLPFCLRYSGMFGMSVLNPICCVLAMNYASPSILAPFSGLTLVWVILGSPLVNNEKPSSQQILACILIISGEVVVAIFGDHTNDENVSVQDVQTSYGKPAFISYFLGLIAYLILLAYWINCSESLILQRFAWGCSGGAITGTQNFLKDSLTIIKATDAHQKYPLIFYPLSLLAAGTAFVGLLLLTACMKRFDATYSAAAFVGSFVVSASVMAAVHYNTFAQLNGILNMILYPSGIMILMLGVYLLVRESNEENDSGDRQRQSDTDGNDDSEDVFVYRGVQDRESEDVLA